METYSARDSTVLSMIKIANRLLDEDLRDSFDEDTFRRLTFTEGQTFTEIANTLIPDGICKSVRLAQMIVSHYARRVLSSAELEEVRQRNQLTGAKQGGLMFRPGGCARIEELEPSTEVNVPWQPAEVADLELMANSEAYVYLGGLQGGRQCYPLIAFDLNVDHHNRTEVRTPNSCMRRYYRLLADREGDKNGQ